MPRTSRFPDPRRAPGDAPLAWGGVLDVQTLLEAYAQGIFPWPVDDGTVFWWSPDPRAIIPLDGLYVSHSLRKTLRSGRFRCTIDTAFGDVVAACSKRSDGGTWIVPQLVEGYGELRAAGAAHSVEVWAGDELAGGLFGVTVGGVFTGESMFHHQTDASKVALVHLVDHLRARGFVLLDAQMPTPHLESLGAVAVARRQFLKALDAAVALQVTF